MPQRTKESSIREKSGVGYFLDVAEASEVPAVAYGVAARSVPHPVAGKPDPAAVAVEVGPQWVRAAVIGARVVEALRCLAAGTEFTLRQLVDTTGIDYAVLRPVLETLAGFNVISLKVDRFGDQRVALSEAAREVANSLA